MNEQYRFKQRNERIVADRLAGVPYREIAEREGMKIAAVWQVIQRHGKPKSRVIGHPSKQLRIRINGNDFEKLKHSARQSNRTVSDIVRELIETHNTAGAV